MPPHRYFSPPPVQLRADVVLDAVGESTEELIDRLRQGMGEIQEGQLLQVISRHEESVEAVLSWCEATGHELVRAERDGREILLWIRRIQRVRDG